MGDKAYGLIMTLLSFLFVIILLRVLAEIGVALSDITYIFGTIVTFVLGFLFGKKFSE